MTPSADKGLQEHLDRLRQLYEQGALNDDLYRAALVGLGLSQEQIRQTVYNIHIDRAEGTAIGDRSRAGPDAAADGDEISTGDIAQSAGVAIGPGARAEVWVAGNYTVYHGPPPRDAAESLAIYRRMLAQGCGQLPLRGVDVGASDPTSGQKPLGLASVYVHLNTTARIPLAEKKGQKRARQEIMLEERETRLQTALEAVAANRHLALLGDPGGGKTTFVHHLAYCLAAHALWPADGWLDRLPAWPRQEADALPILVILRDLARSLPDPLPQRAEPCHLWEFIAVRLKAQNLAFAARPLAQMLEAGRALLMLDGLDEVPADRRAFVRDAVMAFVERYPANRCLVTCRVLSYQPPAGSIAPDLRLPGFLAFELAPFDEGQIDRFITAWYDELAHLGVVRGEDAPGLAVQLRQAVQQPDLWRLAANPLLLTVMALVHTHQGRLPDTRALLYEQTVDMLLWRWEQLKLGGTDSRPRLRELLRAAGRADVDLKRALWKLAYDAHAEVGDQEGEPVAGIAEHRLIKALAGLKGGDLNWAAEVVEVIKLRAGLLLERSPEVYAFPHRTFQEYLAGAHLASLPAMARCAADLAQAGAAWREAILLAVGRLVYLAGDTDKPLALVGELCPAQEADDAVSWRKAWLAGDALLEMGTNRVSDSALGRDLLARVRGRLADLLTWGRLSPRERAAAGRTLAILGDPRPGVGVISLPLHVGEGAGMRAVPDIVWVDVPAGEFWMGGEQYDDEKPVHRVYLEAFQIARVPITNAQYRLFVEATGHRAPSHWSDGRVPRGLESHPVVNVSWHDALAYCRWLSQATGKAIALPSEAQWEKAARGGLPPLSSPPHPSTSLRTGVGGTEGGREYPWGDEWDETKCNTYELGLGSTTPVGIFPEGASPYGCLDMAGNVWEWTASLWGKDVGEPDFKCPYDPGDGRENLEAGDAVLRVLRGGSFNYPGVYARCSVRLRLHPDLVWYYGGFRVVFSPIAVP